MRKAPVPKSWAGAFFIQKHETSKTQFRGVNSSKTFAKFFNGWFPGVWTDPTRKAPKGNTIDNVIEE